MPLEVALGRTSDEERHPEFSLVLGSDCSVLSKAAAGGPGGLVPSREAAEAKSFANGAAAKLKPAVRSDHLECHNRIGNASAQLIAYSAAVQTPELPVRRHRVVDGRNVQNGRRRRSVVHFREMGRQRPTPARQAPSIEVLHASLNMLSAQVLILDATGAIVASNLSAQRFAAENGLTAVRSGSSTTDLFKAWSACCPQVSAMEAAIVSLLGGGHVEFRMRYGWHTRDGVRWFDLRASRHDCGDQNYLVIASEDVTAHIQAEQTLGEAAEHRLSLQESERQVIAQELHDSTAQHIVAAALNLVGLRDRLEDRSDALECLERAEASLDEACKEIRSFTYLLHPPCLEIDGLGSAVRQYVGGFGARTGMRTKVRISKQADGLPDVLQRSLLRVVQEALGNVHRHASATQVTVWLRRARGSIHLIIVDNGRGMGGGQAAGWLIADPIGRGVGLSGIRARLRQFGGKLAIKSGRKGTMLHAAVPVMPAATRECADVRLHQHNLREARM